MNRITVTKEGFGWAMTSDVLSGQQLFRDGSSAEAAAVRLASGFARTGAACEIVMERETGGGALHFTIPGLDAVLDRGGPSARLRDGVVLAP
jgi:hypothetical protein